MVLPSAVAATGAVEPLGWLFRLKRLVPAVCLLMAAGLGEWALRCCLFHPGTDYPLARPSRPAGKVGCNTLTPQV